MPDEGANVAGLLSELSQGQSQALDRLVPLVYDQLRRIAHGQLKGERSGHTLNTTALVHETYLRLVNINEADWKNRAHFFAIAARVMRRILIDYARARNRAKRGGAPIAVSLSEAPDAAVNEPEDLLALEEALARLEALNPRQCRVIECRCISGLSVEETAAALNTSPATVKREWAFARAWLNRELGQDGGLRSGLGGSSTL